MKHIITLMTFFISVFCFAQAKHDSLIIEVVRQIVKPPDKGEVLLYSNSLSSEFSQYCKRKLNRRSYIFFEDGDAGDTLVLTKKEKDYIIRKLDSVQNYSWKEEVFPNSKIVVQDTLWDYLLKNHKAVVHQFSKPIFIRDNSICLIYYMIFKGAGGPSYFGFYKKKNGIWEEWISVSSGYLN
jgi:hypothetical protein